jgi:hypothetical protein
LDGGDGGLVGNAHRKLSANADRIKHVDHPRSHRRSLRSKRARPCSSHSAAEMRPNSVAWRSNSPR